MFFRCSFHRDFVVENLSAFHQAALVWGEGEAAVHGWAVVEEDEGADLPLVGPDEARLFEMGVQFAEQGVAVLAAEADHVFGQVRPYVERAPTCFGVGADDGVGDVLGGFCAST